MAPPTSSGPGSGVAPETAAILEFACLYTHDIVRKKKRWQDGRLRFHTFNKRIMVYDAAMNFIDGQHRRTNEGVNEGDDFQLDGGVLVQVEQQERTVHQDLTELRKPRKSQDSPKRGTSSDGVKGQARTQPADVRGYASSAPKARSLQDVLKKSKNPAPRLPERPAAVADVSTREKRPLATKLDNPRPPKARKAVSRRDDLKSSAVAYSVSKGITRQARPPISDAQDRSEEARAADRPQSLGQAEDGSSEVLHGRAVPNEYAQARRPKAVRLDADKATKAHKGTRHKGRLHFGGSSRHKLVCRSTSHCTESQSNPNANDGRELHSDDLNGTLQSLNVTFSPVQSNNVGHRSPNRAQQRSSSPSGLALASVNPGETPANIDTNGIDAQIMTLPSSSPLLGNINGEKEDSSSPCLRQSYPLPGSLKAKERSHESPSEDRDPERDALPSTSYRGSSPRASEIASEDEDIGPWSREAFDLFG